MKRLSALFLALVLLLSGCAGQHTPDGPSVSAQDALEAMLAAAPEGAEDPEIVSGETINICLALYGVSADRVKQCAVARLGGARIFELAVIEAADTEAADEMAEALSVYLDRRWADFGGYAPEQAAIAKNGQVKRHGSPWVLLILSADPDAVYNAFLVFLGQEPDPVGSVSLSPSEPSSMTPPAQASTGPISAAEPSTEPSADPTPSLEPPAEPTAEPEPSAEPTAEPVPTPSTEPEPTPSSSSVPPGRMAYVDPNIDDMTIYDTSAILAAWESGDDSALISKDLEILNRCREILSEILTDDMSDYEKEVAVFRWVTSHVTYDYDHYDQFADLSPDSSTPYNPLMYGKGICLGFSVTFQLLMDLADVECITVIGAANDSLEDHAWNMVRLNGQWYCVDTTWDAGVRQSSWRYFNVTSDYLALHDHQWDYSSVPEATATDKGKR